MSMWLIIVGMGLVTVAIRLSLIVTAGRFEMPKLVQQGLRFVPPAVLAAIFVPDMFLRQPDTAAIVGSQHLLEFLVQAQGAVLDISLGNHRLLAGLVAIAVAWRTKNVIVTILAGLAVLWLLSLLSAR